MDSTIEEAKKADEASKQPSLIWLSLRDFVLLTFALIGGFVLIDLYSHGQSIRGYLLHGAFISAVIVLVGLRRVGNRVA